MTYINIISTSKLLYYLFTRQWQQFIKAFSVSVHPHFASLRFKKGEKINCEAFSSARKKKILQSPGVTDKKLTHEKKV